MRKNNLLLKSLFTLVLLFVATSLFAGESEIKIPDLNKVSFALPGEEGSGDEKKDESEETLEQQVVFSHRVRR